MLGDLPAEYQALFPDLEGDSYVEIADVTVQKDNGKLLTFKNSILLEEGEDVKFTSFAKHPCRIENALMIHFSGFKLDNREYHLHNDTCAEGG